MSGGRSTALLVLLLSLATLPAPSGGGQGSIAEPLMVLPQHLMQGETATGSLRGTDLMSATSVTVSGTGVTITLGAGDNTWRTITVTAASDAPIGYRTVTLTTGAVERTCYGCLEVRHATGGAWPAELWSWGYDGYGELGQGLNAPRTTPQLVVGMDDVISIDASWSTAVAVTADGDVYAWGNQFGSLRTTPERIQGIPPAVQAATGPFGYLAVTTTGEVWAWSDGTTPAKVVGLTDIVDVDVSTFGMALSASGDVYTWGYNFAGQLGDGTTTTRMTPQAVLTDAMGIAAGVWHGVAVLDNGNIMAWGSNIVQQLGTTGPDSPSPVQVPGVPAADAVASLAGYTAARTLDGDVWTWGDSDSPSKISSFQDVVEVDVGSSHVMGLDSQGDITVYGLNQFGEFGDGTILSSAVSSSDLTDADHVAAGAGFSVAVREGQLYTWGSNDVGQVGDGTRFVQTTPATVALPGEPRQVSAGDYWTMASWASGSDLGVSTWGMDVVGELADATTMHRDEPDEVSVPFGVLSAGYGHGLTTEADGQVHAWGYNVLGQVGDGTYGTRHVPVAATDGIVSASAGRFFSIALDPQGDVFGWGSDLADELGGQAPTGLYDEPTKIFAGEDFVQVSAGMLHSVALRADGTVAAWGANYDGSLGTGDELAVDGIHTVPGIQDAVQVVAGDTQTYVLLSDGSVLGWGYYLPLPGDTLAPRSMPTPPAVKIAASATGLWGIAANGSLWGFGWNDLSQLTGTPEDDVLLRWIDLPGAAVDVAASHGSSFAIVQGDAVTAEAAGPATGQVGASLAFQGEGTGTGALSYRWDFGDGATSTDEDPTHAFSSPGTYTVTLTVTDELGHTDTDTVQVQVPSSTATTSPTGTATTTSTSTTTTTSSTTTTTTSTTTTTTSSGTTTTTSTTATWPTPLPSTATTRTVCPEFEEIDGDFLLAPGDSVTVRITFATGGNVPFFLSAAGLNGIPGLSFDAGTNTIGFEAQDPGRYGGTIELSTPGASCRDSLRLSFEVVAPEEEESALPDPEPDMDQETDEAGDPVPVVSTTTAPPTSATTTSPRVRAPVTTTTTIAVTATDTGADPVAARVDDASSGEDEVPTWIWFSSIGGLLAVAGTLAVVLVRRRLAP